jgi:hypothetical protein
LEKEVLGGAEKLSKFLLPTGGGETLQLFPTIGGEPDLRSVKLQRTKPLKESNLKINYENLVFFIS